MKRVAIDLAPIFMPPSEFVIAAFPEDITSMTS